MAIILFVLVIIVNLFLVLTNKKSFFVFAVSLIVLALLMGFSSTSGGDLFIYEQQYYVLTERNWEAGYNWLTQLLLSAHFSFEGFRFLIFIICSLLMFFTFKKITSNYNFIVLLYTISFFYFFCVTIRYYVAFSIIIFSFRFIHKRNIVFYLGCVLIASLFHNSALFALVFCVLFFPYKAYKTIFRVLTVFLIIDIVAVLLMIVFPNLIVSSAGLLLNAFGGLFNQTEYLAGKYFAGNYSRVYSLYSITYLLDVFISFKTYSSLKKKCSQNTKHTLNKLFIIVLLCSSLIPLLLLSQTFVRFLFIGVAASFCIFSKCLESHDNNSIKDQPFLRTKTERSGYVLLTCLAAFAWFALIYLRNDFGYDIARFLENNKLFGGF